ncbi:hypothetical protein predicted by Glimmer/Critica [Acetobacter senegalensis]|uniref:Uncharacterized protein n=1 Tax=Acetobacter senegalensis TaxID=446692 RepID=A0A0U5BAG6_9PROT|nr:hypothetical protein predicted by Glimmer/Critica [Acetobacter senegalensis]
MNVIRIIGGGEGQKLAKLQASPHIQSMAFKHISLLKQSTQPGHSLTGLLLVASPALGDTPCKNSYLRVCPCS